MRNTLLCILLLQVAAGQAFAKVKAVASSTDIASIVREIGRDKVDVTSIGKGKSNLHFVEVLPSFMLQVSQADVYFKVGLVIDQWAAGIIDGSRNNSLAVIDCSQGIAVLDKPSTKVDASMGDVHPEGNPHYWLDPRNGRIIAQNVLNGLSQVDPGDAAVFKANYDGFSRRLDSAWQVWAQKAEGLKGMPVVSYHSTWAYFANAFGVDIAGYIEPKPGIEPTASHTSELIELIKGRGIKTILREPYFSDRAPKAIAAATGATVCNVPSSVGGTDDARDYFSLFDALINTLVAARGKS